MYLYDTPRDTMAKDPMFQSLCSTSTWKDSGLMPNTSNLSFHVFQSFMLNKNINTHVIERFLLNTTLITHVLQSSSLNTKHLINHVLQGPHPTQTSIYISSTIGFHPIYKTKSSCSYAVEYSTKYIKIKHQDNIIINRFMPISVRSKIHDITSLPA